MYTLMDKNALDMLYFMVYSYFINKSADIFETDIVYLIVVSPEYVKNAEFSGGKLCLSYVLILQVLTWITMPFQGSLK